MSNILIELAAEFTGKKAFKQADSATEKLYKTTKKLAASLGIAFGAKAVIAYSKASMKAAAADQKSQSILASNLKNLGLAYANVNSEAFIKSMETQTHIADDLLRPAYSQLAQVTGSIALTQKIMAIAFDTANGAGLDYSATVNILSQAYVGNRKGLKQLQTGLTTAQLAALSFDELLVVLTSHFGGAGEAAIKGYAGQMDALSISMGNVQEILGGALLDSFAELAGGGNITKATSKVEKLAEAFAGVLRVLTGVYDINAILNQVEFGGFLGVVPKNKPASSVGQQSPGDRAAIDKANAAAKKRAFEAGAAARKLAAAQAAAAAKKALADKKSADLSKAAAAFDLNRISIAAALQATYDNDTKLRLLAMQAIEDEDGEKALGYLNQLKILQDSVQTAKLAGITTISAKSLEALNATLLAELAAINKTKMSEEDKSLARDAAFAKYNDALTKQGGLAAANEYNERVQIQLTSIAKLAAIAKTGAALATLNTIMVSNELAIATTQSANDLARYSALKDYITLLGVAYNAAIALAAANAAAAVIVPKVPNVPYVPKPTPRGVLPDYLDDPVIPPYVPRPIPRGVLPDYLDISTSIGSMASSTGNGGGGSNTIKIEIVDKTSGLIEVVQQAVQTNNRYGNNLDYAGAI